MLRSQQSVMQYDGSDEDDDISIMDDDENELFVGMEPTRRGGGGAQTLGRGGGGLGRGNDAFGGGFGGGMGGGGGYDFDVPTGGGADPYSFDMPTGAGGFKFDFDPKAPFGGDDLDFDVGPRRKAAPAPAGNAQSSAARSAVAKPAAKSGSMVTAMKLDVDDKFKKWSSAGKAPASAPAASKAKPAAATLDDFLMDSDSDSDSGRKPVSSNQPGAGRAQASAARKPSKSPPDSPESPREEDPPPKMSRSKSKAPVANASIFAEAASALGGGEASRYEAASEDENDLSSSMAHSSMPSPQASRPPPVTSAPSPPIDAGSRENSASPAQTPRAGFVRGPSASGSPVSSQHSSYRASSVHSSRSNDSQPRPMGKVMQMSDLLPSDDPPLASTMGKVMQMSELAPASTVGKVMQMSELAPASTVGKAMQMSDLPQSSTTGKGSAAAALAAAAIAEAELDSSASQVASYTQDFVGESTVQGVSAQQGTYADDFDPEDSGSVSSTPSDSQRRDSGPATTRAALAAISEAKPKLMTMGSLPVPAAKASTVATTAPVAAAAAGAKAVVTRHTSGSRAAAEDQRSHRRRPSYSEDGSDDDYRPRRPTCNVGIQADVPVSVGVQCDIQTEPRPAPDDPFGPWMQSGPATAAGASGAAGFPAVSPYGPPHPYLNGGFPPPYGCPTPFGPYGFAPPPYNTMPPSLHPHWGGYTMPPQAMPQSGPNTAQHAATHPLLRQLFGAAITGPRVGMFNPPVRATGSSPCEGETATGSEAAGEGEAAAASSSAAPPRWATAPIPVAGHPMGAFGSSVYSMPYAQQGIPSTAPGIGTALGAPSPAAMAALGLVDESFREQIELLRKAAARHRSLLEKAQIPASATARPASFTTAEAADGDNPAV